MTTLQMYKITAQKLGSKGVDLINFVKWCFD